MKAKLVLLCLACATGAFAGDPSTEYSATVLRHVRESMRFENLITPRRDLPVIQLGRSDYVFSGPLAEGFRPLPHQENLSRGQRFLRLPLVRLLVPKPMPWPDDDNQRYFAWRSCSQPWAVAASRPDVGKGPE